jgi:hypothetical protein
MRRILPVLAALCLIALPLTADAAVAFGGITENQTLSSGGTLTAPTVTGSNPLGVCALQDNNGSANGNTGGAITWGGSSMTLATSTQSSTVLGFNYLFYIINPTSAGSIVGTWAGTGTMGIACAYYTGVNLSTPIDVSTSTLKTTATSMSVFAVTTVNNDWTVLGYNYAGGTLTAGSGTTKRGSDSILADSNAAVTPAANTSLTVNVTPTEIMAGNMIAIEPAATVTATSQFGYFNSFWW